MKKLVCAMLTAVTAVSLMLCPVSAVQIDSTGQNTVTVNGSVEPTILSADVTLSGVFVVRPNAEQKEDRFISSTMSIENTCNVPLNITVENLKAGAGAPKVVSSSLYTDDEWDMLGMADTKSSIALGLLGTDVDFWFAAEDAQTPQVINRLAVGGSNDYSFQAKHGLVWDQAVSYTYEMTFALSMDA